MSINQRPRLLVIDDDDQVRKLTVHSLQHDFFVVDAPSGMDGYARALQSRPDVVLLDIGMEPWSGIDTLKHFRQNPRFAGLPIVMFSGNVQRGTVLDCLEAGANDYVLKTSTKFDHLAERLKSVVKEA